LDNGSSLIDADRGEKLVCADAVGFSPRNSASFAIVIVVSSSLSVEAPRDVHPAQPLQLEIAKEVQEDTL
jgi:hypothetical protein